MKTTRILIFLLLAGLGVHAQVVLDCEQGRIQYYEVNCWEMHGLTFVHNQNEPITGGYSTRTDQMNSTNPQNCYIKTPWMKPGNGLISFNAKFDLTTGTSRSVLISYIPYNAAQPNGEGSPIQFYVHNFPAPFSTSVQTISVPIPGAIVNSQFNYKFVIYMIGTGNNARLIADDFVFPGTYFSNPAEDCMPLPEPVVDTDGDDVPDQIDQFPNDIRKAFENHFPSAVTPGTLSFEDQWPKKGDYDFNDVVVDYIMTSVVNGQNQVVELNGAFTLRASGAGFHNGFGFQLDDIPANKVLSVTGNAISPSSIFSFAGNGLEANQPFATCIVFDDFYDVMTWPGVGTGINTNPNAPFVPYVTLQVKLTFIAENGEVAPGGLVSNTDFIPNKLNFFLVADQTRGKEIHMPGRIPTSLVDASLFGTEEDASNPATGKYYQTSNNLPWALNVLQGFDYPLEKVRVDNAYNKFLEWAASSGTNFTDWYTQKSGYRNVDLVY